MAELPTTRPQELVTGTTDNKFVCLEHSNAELKVLFTRLQAAREIRKTHPELDQPCELITTGRAAGLAGTKTASGYIQIGTANNSRKLFAHHVAIFHHQGRLMMEYAAAQVHTKIDVSHLCHQPNCISPHHLVYEENWVNRSRAMCIGGCDLHKPSCLITGNLRGSLYDFFDGSKTEKELYDKRKK